MNKIYKVIWNATLSAWVAVSELAKGKTKSSKVTGIIGAATVSLMITFSSDVTANVINTDSNNCITRSNGIVGTINPGTTGGQATDGSGTYSTVAGCNAKGNDLSAVTAYGAFSEVTGNAGTAIGHNSQANAFGTAVGVESRATGVGSTALGEGSQSTGQNAVALGGTATGTANGNVLSVANAVTASASGAVAIGGNAVKGAQSAGTDAVAIGAQSAVSTAGTGAVALGARTNATASGAVAIGDGANASIAGSTALGASTTTSASVNSTAQTINGKSYTATGTASTGVVSVGSSTIKRQIQNVAAGQVTASSTDAINGSQLFNTNTELAKVATDTATALGGGATAGTAAGGITAPSYTITKTDASTTTVNNVGAAVSALNAEVVKPITFTGTTGTTSQKLGSSVAVIGDSKNISTAVTANQIKVSISDNPTFTSVTTGNTVLNNAGVTADQVAVGGVVINKTTGINAGGLAITNVAAPTAGTDATNKTYVDSKAAASKTEVAGGSNIAGVAKTTGANGQDVYTVNANGTTASAGSSAVTVTAGTKDANNVTDYKVDLATSTKTDIQKGVDAKTAVDNTGLTFKGDTAATSTTKKLGDTVSITGDTNISTVATANGVQVKLNPNLDLGAAGSVKTGNTTINNAGVTADQVAVGGVVINKTTGINAGGLAITNVAAPTAGTDATNKTYVDSKAAASKTEVTGGSNIAGVTKTTGANGQDIYTVNANGTTASAGSSAVTVTAGTKDANNVTDYKVDLATSTKTDIQKGVDAKTAVDNTGLTFKGDSAATSTTKKLGDTVSITGDTNISTVATANGVQVKLNPNLDLGAAGSVTTGNSKLDNSGLTITGGPSVTSTGINAGNKTITNVAAPTNNTDAANKKYVDDAGATLTNLGFGLKAQDGTTVNKKLGEAVDIVGSNSNITTKVNAGKVEVALSNALDLGAAGSVTTGATVINNAGITATQVTANKVTVNNAPTAGTDATNKTYVDSKSAASKTEVAGGSNIAGVAKTTGANGQDIYTVNANGTTASAGSSAVTVTAGTKDANNVTDYKVDLATSTKTDIQKGVDAKTAVDNTGLTFKGDTAATSTTKKLGDTVSITGDTNISTVATTDGVQVKLNPNLDLGTAGSVTTGATVINNAGITATQVTANKVTVNNAPTAGTDATNKTYVDSKSAASKTEVAGGSNIAGVAKTTGANGQDIYTVNANGTTASAGSSAVTVTAGTKDANNVTDYKVDLATSTKTDIQKGVDAKTAVDNTGLTFKGDTAATSTTKKLGDTVSITGDTNISTVATTDGVQVKLNPNLDLGAAGSVITGNSKLDNSGLTITGGPSVTSSGINAANKNISNVADATTDDQAVNKGQLDAATTASSSKTDALGNSTATNLGGGSKYDNSTGAISAPSYVTTKTDGTTTTANNVGDALTNLNTEVVKPVTFTGN
ncbi:beta strand repeat-containing protein, partial [Acinetobacter guillouiae]|uniref:beta strand repeat-containing protein n=4 Tax=Acinetobacter TaxID=469 RepID=UPI003AF9D8EF